MDVESVLGRCGFGMDVESVPGIRSRGGVLP